MDENIFTLVIKKEVCEVIFELLITPLMALDDNIRTLTEEKPDTKGLANWLIVSWSLRTRKK
jgi:hypothetical protein